LKLNFLNRLINKKKDPVKRIERIIGYKFNDQELLKTALSHRSSLKETGLESNERLEFLGDAVLGFIVSSFLYNRNSDLSEGELTRMKSSLVNETTLSKAALSFDLGDYILLSPEEEKSGGRTKPSITSDAFEALIAAVYLDGGIKPARNLVKKFILKDYIAIVEDKKLHNYKGELLELLQARGLDVPQYKVIEQTGPDHDKIFKVGVYYDNRLLGEGEGRSKKEAEQQAAKIALKAIKKSKL
jgi:ribonuclease-3